ncbi:MAG TPA: dipeptide/oligopeptide/nickel ABC transporter permease/ATP-binding protein [Streptomyces sp.]|uniref:dipeptide/oligopeptide/nickel ABC transporter permease/ATP-binding protein n=1 Tax=Streptomyces sp. TaxID=1931 RepID=UPI002CE824F4|nr:dipeptide/oligopeptide/nickel ABC transporter permease/ATP-binding protein [Streptomyces sp.]HWU07636.1 dipeptide/oligopeptide/nickel ABC transporter permease/ATP-binding protein [Streptomyces sp.]
MSDAVSHQVTPQSDAPVAGRALWRRVLSNPVGFVTVLLLILALGFGLAAPWLAPFDPNLLRLEVTNDGPFQGDFLLGGDNTGRDILSRLMFATRSTIMACLVVLVVSSVLGGTTGLIAGYFGGRLDDLADWVSNVFLALPGIVLLIVLYTVIGPNIMVAMAVYGVLLAPSYFRLVRSSVKSIRNELYVDAARVAGLTDGRIVARHILRAVRGPIIVHSSFVVASGIGIQSALEFLGLGDPSKPSLGGMLQDAFANIYLNRVAVVWPVLLIGVSTLCLVLLGNVIRDALQSSANRPTTLAPSVVRRLRAAAVSGSEAPAAAVKGDRPSLLRVRDLAVAYPDSTTTAKAVVHGVDLTVERGEIHGLVGESGSGKSQVALSILGILPPEAVILRGAIEFQGEDLLAAPKRVRAVRGRRIGYVPQEPLSNLDPAFTIGQQLTYGLRAVKDVSRRDAREQLLELLDSVGIRDCARVFDLYPHQVSGGMAQRVLIAGALAGDPELIIADEPTTALDVTVQADVLDLLRNLQQERELGMVIVTHNLGVVADICDKVSVMQSGRIVECGNADDLFTSPEHEYTQMLLSSTLDGAEMRKPLTVGSEA